MKRPTFSNLSDLAVDAYGEYLDSLEDRRSDEPALTFEQFRNRLQAQPLVLDPDDDFPY
jgi:hypothetical protein